MIGLGKVPVSLCAGGLAVAIAGPVAAADNAAVTGHDWQGFYGGLALGGAYSEALPDTEVLYTGYFNDNVNGSDAAQVNPILQRKIGGRDFTGSALLGYDFQSGHIIYGIEADLTLMDFSESEGQGRTAYDTVPVLFFTTDTTVETNFLFNLRPKIGYATGNLQYYVSVGPSVSRIKTTTRFTDDNGGGNRLTFTDTKTAFGVSSSVGAGYHMGDGWSLRGDCVFSYFPNSTHGTAEFDNDTRPDFRFDGHFRSHNIRLALIKQF